MPQKASSWQSMRKKFSIFMNSSRTTSQTLLLRTSKTFKKSPSSRRSLRSISVTLLELKLAKLRLGWATTLFLLNKPSLTQLGTLLRTTREWTALSEEIGISPCLDTRCYDADTFIGRLTCCWAMPCVVHKFFRCMPIQMW